VAPFYAEDGVTETEAAVVRNLVDAQELGPNRIVAGGRGEFDPSTSNETSEGQSRNRRIEIRLTDR